MVQTIGDVLAEQFVAANSSFASISQNAPESPARHVSAGIRDAKRDERNPHRG
jgi:hypothetical protein